MNNVLVLGDGLLGSELVKQTGWDYISRKKDDFDVLDQTTVSRLNYTAAGYDAVINCIGCTDTYSDDKDLHMKVNYRFPVLLSHMLGVIGIKHVHISTDYVYAEADHFADSKTTMLAPIKNNWYSYSKMLADEHVQLFKTSLIVRCGHKPRPYPHEYASSSIWGNFDYVDVIAKKIIENIDKEGVINVGTKYKSMYDLAIQTKPDVIRQKELPRALRFKMPKDVSMRLDV